MASKVSKPEGISCHWSEGDDWIIYEAFLTGQTYKTMGLRCGKPATKVRDRLRSLGLINEAGGRMIEPPLFDTILARHHPNHSLGPNPTERGNDP